MIRVTRLMLLAAAVILVAPDPSMGQHAEKIPEGPGAELVAAKCALCHDLGNITRIRQSREEWEDTIKVMVRRGAPVSPEEEKVILDYLTKHYGR